MCGIAGFLSYRGEVDLAESTLRRMLASIRHRGPDEFGMYLGDCAALGNARLSIVDLEGGQQPVCTEDERYWIVYNGEIFNHCELRSQLERHGCSFSSHCDTEVFLKLFVAYGPSCLHRLNGQFAVAIWDSKEEELFIARDRLGVRPLYYSHTSERFVFGSEIKAIACHPDVSLSLDPDALHDVFVGWSVQSPQSPFREIQQLPPGCFARVSASGIEVQRYWEPGFPHEIDRAKKQSDEEYLEEFGGLLADATRLRLNADVPVGSYLSGGLDSSVIASLARKQIGDRLDTFSIAFTDAAYDERGAQQEMAKHIGTQHHVVEAKHNDIAEIFPSVVWHTETSLLRTAPAPMFLLSKLVRGNGYKVVLTGEGADEFLVGYDIFKETMIRHFWSRSPESKWRSSLFQRIYPDLANLAKLGPRYLSSFFGERLTETSAADYSHAVRWKNTSRTTRFFSQEFLDRVEDRATSLLSRIEFPNGFENWSMLSRAQFLEISTFMSPYLLAAQGDRVAMANSVEGRYPFLDHRVVEFCNRLPARLKLRGLKDKRLLRKLGSKFLPRNIWDRPKKPYRAPIHRSFINKNAPSYVGDLLCESAISNTGYFNPKAVSKLVGKIRQGGAVGETDDMALVGIISTQLVHHQFVENFSSEGNELEGDNVKVCDRRTAACTK